MATDDRPVTYATPRRPLEKTTSPVVAYGCLALLVGAVVLWVAGSMNPAPRGLDLTTPTTFTLKPGYLACVTEDALNEGTKMTNVGDQAAVRRFLADRANGCVLTTTGGARVYTERASYGVERVRAAGRTTAAYVLKEALAP